MKLKEKRREGARQIKQHDAPKTPYQRLLESGALDAQKRASNEEKELLFLQLVDDAQK